MKRKIVVALVLALLGLFSFFFFAKRGIPVQPPFLGSSIFSSAKPESTIQFYYWKNKYRIDGELYEKVKELECNRVYLHYFDVVWRDFRATPVAQLAPVKDNPLYGDSVRIVPVVFITNEVFSKCESGEEVRNLASNVNNLVEDITQYNDTLGRYDEIQIDCDWTLSTRSNYYSFLDSLAKVSKKNISCTIRLHQIKDYGIIGAPPVKKGCLMCYATSDPTDGASSNSILDINLLKNYTKNLNDYPLQLTYALPLFSWGVVKNHEGKVKLVNGLTREMLETDNFSHIGGNNYKAENDCFVNGFYISKGFTVELEEVSPALLKEARQYLNDKVGKHTVVYFHLSKGYLNRFPITDLK